ncbi:AAA family ATPase (plasmid) [Pseudarthrobacter sp. BIM B-2242]|nr:AAA family ATPase [Pseudarthrobacter sp. BIM B-2242]
MRAMSFGLDLADLGIEPVTSSIPAPEVVVPEGRNLVIGSVLAKALHSVWSGAPVTIVDSPPGAGKSTLVTEIVAILHERSDLKIYIACPTKNGAIDLASRIAQEMGPDKDGRPQIILAISKTDPPAGVAAHDSWNADKNLPVVRTVKSLELAKVKECDLMIIDEAYQVTFAAAASAADQAQQVLMVGDPGQIGPVVTHDVSLFKGKEMTPQMRAPEGFARFEDAEIHSMGTTYRLGQETVDAIGPLYKFPFTSSRPDRYLTDENGDRVSEIVPMTIPAQAKPDALETLETVANYAHSLIGVGLVETDRDGTLKRRTLGTADICVVVAHNAQASGVRAVLKSLKAETITVGTADSLQGGQWHAVVALDPFTGVTSATAHQLSPGRLCVMASRHMSHLTWITDGGWELALLDPDIDPEEAALGRKVRYALTAQ